MQPQKCVEAAIYWRKNFELIQQLKSNKWKRDNQSLNWQ